MIRTIYMDLPERIKAYTVASGDGYYTIVLNSKLSREQNLKSYEHELSHVLRGDFEKQCSADLIELYAHKEG